MSAAHFLDKLLDDAESAWLPLGDESFFEIANTARRPVKASLRTSGEIPYYGANNIQDYVDGHTHEGEYVLIAEDGSASLENYSIQYVRGKFWANNHVHVVRGTDKVNTRFLFHYLTMANFLPFLSSKGRAKLTKANLVQITVPIPCPDDSEKSLTIQAEIVRILDKFTKLTAELTAELSQRKKQFNHYRDQFLTFNDNVGTTALSQCCLSISDGDHQAPPKVEAGIPFVTISNVSENKTIDFSNTKFVPKAYYDGIADKRKARTNDILYTVVGSYGIPIFIEDDRKFAFQRHIAILRPNEDLLVPKYLYHVLQSSEFIKQAHAVAVGAAQKTITLTALNRMHIPIPSLAEQIRIVAILDKFDTLTTSLTEGLPREIQLREKQYAYYRDRLLSFPKPDAEAA